MILTDIHTHNRLAAQEGNAILNCEGSIPCGVKNASAGLHPWFIDVDWQQRMQQVATTAASECVKAIGECGIDLIKSNAGEELQETILRRHIELSEKLQKPLILHIVKGQEAIMRLRREYSPTQAWIIHGFRGKLQQARQYIAAGFHLSFGRHFNSEALTITPIERLFVESDDDETPLVEIYSSISKAMGIEIENLADSIMHNCRHCGLMPREE